MSDKSFWSRYLGLCGSSSELSALPTQCASCGSKHLYCQADFNRAIGLWLVGFASVLTVVFAATGYNWYLTWSPLLVFFFFDRATARVSPEVVICYECEHLHRGLVREEVRRHFEAFDLNIHDRLKYQERTA